MASKKTDKKSTLCSWKDLTNVDRFVSLSSLLRKYGMKVYPTDYPQIFVLENDDKKGIVYPFCLLISKKEITQRRSFWDFESEAFSELIVAEKKSLPSFLLVSNALTIALHRDMYLSASLASLQDYVYNDGILAKKLGDVICPVALITKDNTFVHVFINDEHIVRGKSYLRDLDAPTKELPFEFNVLRERIVSLFVSRDFEDLLRNKAQGRVEEAFHPCYQIDSIMGSFLYYALSPPVIEFKNPSITLILPPSFDIRVRDVREYMSKIPSPKTLSRLLRGYIVGPVVLELLHM